MPTQRLLDLLNYQALVIGQMISRGLRDEPKTFGPFLTPDELQIVELACDAGESVEWCVEAIVGVPDPDREFRMVAERAEAMRDD